MFLVSSIKCIYTVCFRMEGNNYLDMKMSRTFHKDIHPSFSISLYKYNTEDIMVV